jgi:hypothetical protein
MDCVFKYKQNGLFGSINENWFWFLKMNKAILMRRATI